MKTIRLETERVDFGRLAKGTLGFNCTFGIVVVDFIIFQISEEVALAYECLLRGGHDIEDLLSA